MDKTIDHRMRRYRSTGGAAALQKVEVLVPPSGRDKILRLASKLRRQYRQEQFHSPELSSLFHEATTIHGPTCLWNIKPTPTTNGLRLIAQRLRQHGGMTAWNLATKIERALNNATG